MSSKPSLPSSGSADSPSRWSVARPGGAAVKRVLDVVASSIGLVLLSPLLGGLALAVRASSPGPAFFRQVRVGRHGRLFRIWKFRTMVDDAERLGPGITAGRDPRITPLGHWLRKTKLDELPQLLNVVRGEMSLVGPRPEIPEYVRCYDDTQRAVLDVRPGITDPASLEFSGEEEMLAERDDALEYYRTVVMPAKLALNLEYRRRATVVSDLRILLATVAVVLGRLGGSARS